MERGRARWLALIGWVVGLVAATVVTYVVAVVLALSVTPQASTVRLFRTVIIGAVVMLFTFGATRRRLGADALAALWQPLSGPWGLLLPLAVAGLLTEPMWTGHLLWADSLSVPTLVRLLGDFLTWMVIGAAGIVLGVLVPARDIDPRRSYRREQEIPL